MSYGIFLLLIRMIELLNHFSGVLYKFPNNYHVWVIHIYTYVIWSINLILTQNLSMGWWIYRCSKLLIFEYMFVLHLLRTSTIQVLALYVLTLLWHIVLQVICHVLGNFSFCLYVLLQKNKLYIVEFFPAFLTEKINRPFILLAPAGTSDRQPISPAFVWVSLLVFSFMSFTHSTSMDFDNFCDISFVRWNICTCFICRTMNAFLYVLILWSLVG